MKNLTLKNEFSKNAVFYKLVQSSGDVRLYSLSYTGYGKHIIGYDVVRVHKLCLTPQSDEFQRRLLRGNDSREYYPGSSKFGESGWSFDTLAMAQKKFNKLVNV